MAIRKTKSSSSSGAGMRGSVRLTSPESLTDVAEKLFKDRRITPLLNDLNPSLGSGTLETGTQVVVPSREVAQAFAAKMGFSLGYNPEDGSNTKGKRKWAKMKAGSVGGGAKNDPAALAQLFVTQSVPLTQGAKRIAALASPEAVDAFLATPLDDESLRPMQQALQALQDRLWLRPRMKHLAAALSATKTPRGRSRLYDAIHQSAEDGNATLCALLVPQPVSAAVLECAHRLSVWGHAARAVAGADASMRDVAAREAGMSHDAMQALIDAYADGVEPFTDARVDALGFAGARVAFEKHLATLEQTITVLTEHLEKAPPEHLRKARLGDVSAPKPWPVLVTLFSRLGERLDRLSAANADAGLATLIHGAPASPSTALSGGPSLTAAHLAHQAARVAKVADDHDGVPERLAPVAAQLFALYRPLPAQTGTEAQVKSKRRTRAEKSVLVAKGTRFVPDVCTAVLEEVLELASEGEDATLKRRAARLKPGAKKGALNWARTMSAPMHLLMREASPVGKAVLVGAIALDPELGPTLERTSGREAASALLTRHGTRTLTLAITRYTDGDL